MATMSQVLTSRDRTINNGNQTTMRNCRNFVEIKAVSAKKTRVLLFTIENLKQKPRGSNSNPRPASSSIGMSILTGRRSACWKITLSSYTRRISR